RADLRQLDPGAGIPEPRRHAGAVPKHREGHGWRHQMEIDCGRPGRRREGHIHGGEGRLDARRPRHRHLLPNVIPSVYAIYSTSIFGESDPVAASAAALETMYLHCPSCLEELRKQNSVNLAGWTTSAYVLTCREPLKTMADLKGKRVRATGGNAEMLKMAGMVPVGATLVEAVGLLQRGGLDCQHGIIDWVRTFGYGGVAKYGMDYPLGL